MQHALLETIYGEKKQWGLNVGVKIDKIWKKYIIMKIGKWYV